ncbi:MAG: DUF5074 domain-containing protein [Bacteroidales bacterium]|nr:DUF5074 domain-containing protein [Bacteroidales bacterium]
MKKITLSTIALAALFAANAETQSATYQDGFFVVNEGRYGTDPGSINWFGADGSMQYNVETLANGTNPLGTTSQYGTIYGNRFYAVSKQGTRLVTFDAATMSKLSSVAEIGGDGRAFVGISTEKAYLGTTDGIRVVDLAAGTVGNKIEGTSDEVGTMERVGNYVFATSRNDIIYVVDPATDALVTTIEASGVSGLTVARDGYVWANCGSTVMRINPVDLQTVSSSVTNSMPTQWGAWKPDLFVASPTEDAIFYAWGGAWSQNKLGKLTLNADGTVADDAEFVFTMPAGITESNTQEFYGTLGIDPHTGYLVAMTVQSGWGSNYTYNWVHLINTETGAIEQSYFPTNANGEGNYWFPSMSVFPDNAEPEITLSDINLANNMLTITKPEFISDDNLPVKAVVTATTESNVFTVENDGLNLTLLPKQNGSGDLKVSVNSNGKVAEKTVTVTVSGVGGVNDIMSGVRVYVSATGSTLCIAGADNAVASLYNASGSRIADIAVAHEATYDMSALATGVYFVRLSQNGTVKTFKVVKRK